MRSLKRFFTFRQGKVSARRYAKEQARLRAGLERGLEKSLVRMFNRRLKAVTDALKAELIPDLDVTAVPLAEEMADVLNDRIRRTFRTVYDYNNDRYKDLNTKGEVSFGFGFGNNAEYDSYISSYLQGRQSYITNISQRMGRSIVGDINSSAGGGLNAASDFAGDQRKVQANKSLSCDNDCTNRNAFGNGSSARQLPPAGRFVVWRADEEAVGGNVRRSDKGRSCGYERRYCGDGRDVQNAERHRDELCR